MHSSVHFATSFTLPPLQCLLICLLLRAFLHCLSWLRGSSLVFFREVCQDLDAVRSAEYPMPCTVMFGISFKRLGIAFLLRVLDAVHFATTFNPKMFPCTVMFWISFKCLDIAFLLRVLDAVRSATTFFPKIVPCIGIFGISFKCLNIAFLRRVLDAVHFATTFIPKVPPLFRRQ